MKQSRLLYLVLLSIVAAAGLFIAVSAPVAGSAWQWNWANVAWMQAEFTAAPAAVFAWSGTAVEGYQANVATDGAQARLLSAYQLRWRSAAQSGHLGEAAAAYAEGHSLVGDVAMPAATCTGPMGAVLEAEEFAGVVAGSLNIPTVVEGRQAVLLFAAQPITHTICLQAAGAYTIHVMAANMAPPPVEVEVAWDGWLAGVLSYAKGDGSLSRKEVQIVSPAGAHELRLTFGNDFSDPATGIDRNAVIESVSITRGSVLDEHK